jgi:hypothetical protein
MSRKKVFLYVSVAFAWVFILLCTFLQDHTNGNSWEDYSFSGENNEITLDKGASIHYGSLSTGDTQVTLQYGKYEVEAIVPNERVAYRALFPAGNKHIGVSFSEPGNLDTLVLFDASQAYVFQHVVAMDSDSGRVANLQTNHNGGVDLVVSSFNQAEISRITLDGHDASFLAEPQIQSAFFSLGSFRLNTALGAFVLNTALPI